jgi:hypothetical protein
MDLKAIGAVAVVEGPVVGIDVLEVRVPGGERIPVQMISRLGLNRREALVE